LNRFLQDLRDTERKVKEKTMEDIKVQKKGKKKKKKK